MESTYQGKQSPVKQQPKQQEQAKKKKLEKAEERNKLKKAAEAAQAIMQSAVSGTELAIPSESLQILAGFIGNQSMLHALAVIDEERNRGLGLCAPSLPEDSIEMLPENEITISWPALRFVVRLNRTGELPKRLFPISALKEEILQR